MSGHGFNMYDRVKIYAPQPVHLYDHVPVKTVNPN
jgi:hypothetical protein